MSNIARHYVDKAFELSFFIHPRKQTALDVTKRALANLEASANAQFKRFYYQPKGRPRSHSSLFKKRRTKVTLPDPALLQRLIYIESDPIERRQETSGLGLVPDDMVVRFIKHLVRITIRRNSFYVTLGICRLLHHYSTAETMDIYNVLAQSWEGDKDADYYRASKKRLMSELAERFGDLVKAKRGPRGEQRFEAQEVDRDLVTLVRQALTRFTPWDSVCPIPPDFDPHLRELESYQFDGKDPDEEHVVEINRIHTMLHPPCLDRLLESMHLAAAEERLEVPLFIIEPFDSDGHRPDRTRPPVLAAEEREAVLIYLKERQEIRKSWKPADISVWVDGCRRTVWNPGHQKKLNLSLDDRSELLELRSLDGTPLFNYLLDSSMLHEPRRFTRQLGGHQLVFEVGPTSGEHEEWNFQVQLQMEPMGLMHHLVRMADRGAALLKPKGLGFHGLGLVMRPLAAATMVFVVGLLYSRFGGFEAGLPNVISEPGTVMASPPEALQVIAEESVTRGSTFDPASPVTASKTIRKIYVDPLGDDNFGRTLRTELASRLEKTGSFDIVHERDLADAVLMDIAEFLGPPNQQLRESERLLVLSLVTVDNLEIMRMSRVVGLKSPTETADVLAGEIAASIPDP